MKLSVSLQLLDLGQSVGLLGRVISSSQGLYLYTNTEKRTHNTYINIHVLSGIRTHGLGVHASEDSSCLRPLGYRDRHDDNYPDIITVITTRVDFSQHGLAISERLAGKPLIKRGAKGIAAQVLHANRFLSP
jgi:hypothetical protein